MELKDIINARLERIIAKRRTELPTDKKLLKPKDFVVILDKPEDRLLPRVVLTASSLLEEKFPGASQAYLDFQHYRGKPDRQSVSITNKSRTKFARLGIPFTPDKLYDTAKEIDNET